LKSPYRLRGDWDSGNSSYLIQGRPHPMRLSRREYALQVMASVCKDKPRSEWEQAIREAYPWGPRTKGK